MGDLRAKINAPTAKFFWGPRNVNITMANKQAGYASEERGAERHTRTHTHTPVSLFSCSLARRVSLLQSFLVGSCLKCLRARLTCCYQPLEPFGVGPFASASIKPQRA